MYRDVHWWCTIHIHPSVFSSEISMSVRAAEVRGRKKKYLFLWSKGKSSMCLWGLTKKFEGGIDNIDKWELLEKSNCKSSKSVWECGDFKFSNQNCESMRFRIIHLRFWVDERMNHVVDSIRENGILNQYYGWIRMVIMRMVSGHRRLHVGRGNLDFRYLLL